MLHKLRKNVICICIDNCLLFVLIILSLSKDVTQQFLFHLIERKISLSISKIDFHSVGLIELVIDNIFIYNVLYPRHMCILYIPATINHKIEEHWYCILHDVITHVIVHNV